MLAGIASKNKTETTSIISPLKSRQIVREEAGRSGIGMLIPRKVSLYYRKWKLTIWHHKKEIPDYLEEMEE